MLPAGSKRATTLCPFLAVRPRSLLPPTAFTPKVAMWKAAGENARRVCEQNLRELLRRTNHPAKLELVLDKPSVAKPVCPPTLHAMDVLTAASYNASSGDIYAAMQRSSDCADTIFLLWIEGLYTVGMHRVVLSTVAPTINAVFSGEESPEVLSRISVDVSRSPVQYIMFYNGNECFGPSTDFEAQARNLLSLPAGDKPMECIVCYNTFDRAPGLFKCGHSVACPECSPKLFSCAMCRETRTL